MNDLTSRALELQHAAHELMYLGMDGEPVYSDTFCRLNKEVLVKSDSLFSAQSSDVENRICLVLEQLSTSLLKVRLLIYTYGEVYEDSMLQEAHSIINNWSLTLTAEQTTIMEELKNIEENPYPFEVL